MKRQSRYAAPLSVALGLWLCGCGTTMQGYVREEGTEQGIQGATVQIGGESTTTDVRGYYSLDVDSDDEDQQRIYVQAPRYESVSRSLMVHDDPDPLVWNVDLVPVDRPAPADAKQAGQPDIRIEQKVESGEQKLEGRTVPAGQPREAVTQEQLDREREQLRERQDELKRKQAALDSDREELQQRALQLSAERLQDERDEFARRQNDLDLERERLLREQRELNEEQRRLDARSQQRR